MTKVAFAIVLGVVRSNIHRSSPAIMIGKGLLILASGILAFSATAQPTVTSSAVTVSDRNYTVYNYADPSTKKFCVVIPEGMKTVRGLLVW